jgi:uncharacterized iron-regulated membrane protein
MAPAKPTHYTKLYQRVWRWHFYAGVMVLPFAIILAISGSIYLFKCQIEAYQQTKINHLAQVTSGTALSADSLLGTLLAQYPQARFVSYTLAAEGDLSVEIELALPSGTEIFWLNQYNGKVLFHQAKDQQLLSWVKDLHGELLAGNAGSYVVELMASWMIVLIISGLYLWWPKHDQLTVFGNLRYALFPPFRGQSSKQKWRSLHGMVGTWISLMVLTLLLSGLPWTQLWGAGFDKVQAWLGVAGPGQEFNVSLQSSLPSAHEGHEGHGSHDDGIELWQKSAGENTTNLQSGSASSGQQSIGLQHVIDLAGAYNMVAPVIIQPPKANNGVWTVRAMNQNRPLRQTVHFDQWTGQEIMHIRFSDYPTLKRLTSYGIALHEGALFGWFNQLLGVIAALGIVTMSVSGALMWWRRRPQGKLAAPKKPLNHSVSLGVTVIVFALAAFLPMVALSLIAVLTLDFITSRLMVIRRA